MEWFTDLHPAVQVALIVSVAAVWITWLIYDA